MYLIRPAYDETTQKPIEVYAAWNGNLQHAWEVYDDRHPSETVSGPWTRKTAMTIMDAFNTASIRRRNRNYAK